jgi:signal transduction histidine kinase
MEPVPLPVSDLFSADRNDHLRDVLDSDPGWTRSAGILSAIGVTVVAFGTFVLSFRHVDRPLVLAILLTAAAAPFVVQCVRDFSHLVLALTTLIPLALLNLAGSPLGVYDRAGRDQMSLMLLVWLVGETASIGRRREVIGVMVAGVVIVVGRVAVDSNYESAFIWSAGIGIALLAGLLIRTLVMALVNTKVADAVLREQATTEERQRIAREAVSYTPSPSPRDYAASRMPSSA